MTNPIAYKTLVLILSWCVLAAWNSHARMPERKPLTLEYCIGIALNESLDAREAANRFMTDYVEYKLYKISRLPVFLCKPPHCNTTAAILKGTISMRI